MRHPPKYLEIWLQRWCPKSKLLTGPFEGPENISDSDIILISNEIEKELQDGGLFYKNRTILKIYGSVKATNIPLAPGVCWAWMIALVAEIIGMWGPSGPGYAILVPDNIRSIGWGAQKTRESEYQMDIENEMKVLENLLAQYAGKIQSTDFCNAMIFRLEKIIIDLKQPVTSCPRADTTTPKINGSGRSSSRTQVAAAGRRYASTSPPPRFRPRVAE